MLLIYIPAADGEGSRTSKPPNEKSPYGLDGEELVGLVLSFPGSETAEPVEYLVDDTYQENERY